LEMSEAITDVLDKSKIKRLQNKPRFEWNY
jgi:hypothetical protein